MKCSFGLHTWRYRNPPGHTFMDCDRVHGHVSKYGKSLSSVASTEEWCNVAATCRTGDERIDSIMLNTTHFRKWKTYLSQMYRSSPRTTTRAKYRILDYRWANFGWGKDPSGMLVHHPGEVWLYTCSNGGIDEWYLEQPVKVVFARNLKASWSSWLFHPNFLPYIVRPFRSMALCRIAGKWKLFLGSCPRIDH